MAAHRSCKCRLLRSDEAIKQVDAKLLYLPPCSLDLNPIEQASLLKASRPCSERLPPEPSMRFGRPEPRPSIASHQTNAETTSEPLDILINLKML